MKKLLAALSSFSTAAQAHESLVPHTHPHGVSMLPGIEIVACGLLALVALLECLPGPPPSLLPYAHPWREAMIKVSVMYLNSPGVRFDHNYYSDKHLPLIKSRMGAVLKYYTIDKALRGGASDAPATYVAMCHLLCDSIEAYQSSFGPYAQELQENIRNFTNQTPIVQISEVVVENSANGETEPGHRYPDPLSKPTVQENRRLHDESTKHGSELHHARRQVGPLAAKP
jgi:uncharacterized protein (TIGR02118 family)